MRYDSIIYYKLLLLIALHHKEKYLPNLKNEQGYIDHQSAEFQYWFSVLTECSIIYFNQDMKYQTVKLDNS